MIDADSEVCKFD